MLTRTLVTRSTEALSGPPPLPPLSRVSPYHQVDPYPLRYLPPAPAPLPSTLPALDLQLPLLSPRDEVSEEIRYKYYRNVEEEERRIRDNQVREKSFRDF